MTKIVRKDRAKLLAQIERLERAKRNAIVQSSQYTDRDRRRDARLSALRDELTEEGKDGS